ncbi:peptidase A24 [Trinickia terrae]|uniref:Peptidase A24 n=1 Tax=Trinickia terrae TaxID=2571161 RepID=A0A4U1IFX4_9BURK|nr:prepilin peptidase [Trinickia terrae]TKC92602.1 peptidase A24 [Trinickia terrae]
MNGVPFPIGPCVVLLVSIAMASDLRTRRIPNWLVTSALALALPVQCALHGLAHGAGLWLAGCLTGGLLFLPGYLMRMMGAGDVKLMAAVGAFCGGIGAFEIALVSGAIGGVFAVIAMIQRRRVRDGVTNAMSALITMSAQPGDAPRGMRHSVRPSVGSLPYGVAIAVGTVCVLFVSV